MLKSSPKFQFEGLRFKKVALCHLMAHDALLYMLNDVAYVPAFLKLNKKRR